jgi:hypothetical protein
VHEHRSGVADDVGTTGRRDYQHRFAAFICHDHEHCRICRLQRRGRRIDAPEVLYAEGGAKVVWVDQRVEKSMPLPQQVREALTGTGA